MSQPDLGNYVEVHERIAAFHKDYPHGSLQSSWQVKEIGDETLLVVEARAYRTPDDQRPGVGLASEPFPGKTPYTKDSELMNGETSAWGRALAALGFEIHRGIASGNEVRARQSNGDAPAEAPPVSDKQRSFFERLVKEYVMPGDQPSVLAWADATLTGGRGGSCSKAIDGLKEDTEATVERLVKAADEWHANQPTDIPVDDADLAPVEEREGEQTTIGGDE